MKQLYALSFYILIALWYGRIASWGIRILVVLPRIWPPVTDMQQYYFASDPIDDWHLTNMFPYVYFSVSVYLREFLVILLAHGQDLMSVLTHNGLRLWVPLGMLIPPIIIIQICSLALNPYGERF